MVTADPDEYEYDLDGAVDELLQQKEERADDSASDTDDLVALRGGGRYFAHADNLEYLGPICRKCNKRGHIAVQCSFKVCETCGKTGDHDTRDCSQGQRCGNCGQIGHLSSVCKEPSRRVSCRRCYARTHTEDLCPFIWRQYDTRGASKELKYPESISCSNCASRSHYGDECPAPRPVLLRYLESSAFSGANLDRSFRQRYFSRLDEEQRRMRDSGFDPSRSDRNAPTGPRAHSGAAASSKKARKADRPKSRNRGGGPDFPKKPRSFNDKLQKKYSKKR